MNAPQQMIFTKSAASSILGNVLPHHVSVKVWDKVALVQARGKRPQFVSKRKFYQEFVNARKERSLDVSLHQQTETEWLANSNGSDEFHHVSVQGKSMTCSCKDYENQVQSLGRGCCKHMYALLSELGFENLREFESMA